MNRQKSIALYAYWFTCQQRPHHLAAAVQERATVNVYSWRGLRVEEDHARTMPLSTQLHLRHIVSSRLRFLRMAERINTFQRARLMLDFLHDDSDVHIYAARPNQRLIRKPPTLVYDCLDEWSEFDDATSEMADIEQELCEMADRIWVVSLALADRLRPRYGSKLDYVPNGVYVEHFTRASILRAERPPSRPTLIYIGAIDTWFDAALVSEVALRLKDWRILLVGPLNLPPVKKQLLDKPNIVLLGKQPYASLPDILADATVAMIPFEVTALTKAVSPIKLYEYLAAGIPTVSTHLPEVQQMQEAGVIACAAGADEFARMTEHLAHTAKPGKCIEVAGRHTWKARFADALSRLSERDTMP